MADEVTSRKKLRGELSFFATLEDALAEEWPGLRLEVRPEKRVVATGTFPVLHNRKLIEEFRIDVNLPGNYPDELPMIWELDGKIPRNSDYHVNPEDGSLCVVLPDQYWLDNEHCELPSYLAGPLRNYFVGAIHFRNHGSWPHGEHAHGSRGILNFYSEQLGGASDEVVFSFIKTLARPLVRGHLPCCCGSEKKLRNCHWQDVMQLRERISPERVADTLSVRRKIKQLT